MKRHIRNTVAVAVLFCTCFGVIDCNKYLDVVPDDGLPSIETAFNLRNSAIRYLATCYSYMTSEGQCVWK